MTVVPSLMPPPEAFATGYSTAAAQRCSALAWVATSEILIEEAPVSLEWNGARHLVMMATPTDLEAFGIGFSLSEGIIDSVSDMLAIDVVPTASGIGVLMQIPDALLTRTALRERAQAGNSSCGLCGIRDLESALRMPAVMTITTKFHPQAILRAMRALPALQHIGASTGAAHAAGFALPSGTLVLACEDAGRHNALDKLVGMLALRGMRPADGFLVLTSRASCEMVQKAAAAGFSMLCAISAPTALAVRLADAAGITLVAFAREARFTCLTHEARIDSHAVLPG
jgi:FdhD protein